MSLELKVLNSLAVLPIGFEWCYRVDGGVWSAINLKPDGSIDVLGLNPASLIEVEALPSINHADAATLAAALGFAQSDVAAIIIPSQPNWTSVDAAVQALVKVVETRVGL